MKKLSAAQLNIARLIQKDIPLVDHPFLELSRICNLQENEVISNIKMLRHKGFIRRFGAITRHQKIGFTKNALVMWKVKQELIESVGLKFAAHDSISHCYERKPAFQDKYNLFTMVHAKDDNLTLLVREISASSGINDYLILESVQEYKKTSPEYF